MCLYECITKKRRLCFYERGKSCIYRRDVCVYTNGESHVLQKCDVFVYMNWKITFYRRDFCVYIIVEFMYHRRNVLCLYDRGLCIKGETFCVYIDVENRV